MIHIPLIPGTSTYSKVTFL